MWNSVRLAVVLLAMFPGRVIAWCDCSDASCPNVHSCYNCTTIINIFCDEEHDVSADACFDLLAASEHSRAVYNQATGKCVLTKACVGPMYDSSNRILFTKTCETGCSNYSITKLDDTAVVFGAGSFDIHQNVYWSSSCLAYCLPPTQDCTVSYDSSQDRCYVYTTNCGGNCATESSSGKTVYKIMCNMEGDCGPLENPLHGAVHTPDGTAFGSFASFSCDPGYVTSHQSSRKCQGNAVWSGSSPTCKLETKTATVAPTVNSLYIMPCICYTNKTFVNLTQEEIIQQLIKDTKIDEKDTALALSKLNSRSDPRMSSKMIGVVSIIVLSIIGGLIIMCDLLTIRASIRRIHG